MSYSPRKRMSVLHHDQSTPSEAKMLTNGAGLDPAVRVRAIAEIEGFKRRWTKPAVIHRLILGTGSVKPPTG